MFQCRHLAGLLLVTLTGLVTFGHAVCPSRCDCRRGELGSIVHCRYQRLQGFPDLTEFPEDTVEIDYGYNNISSMAFLPTLPSLKKLVLDNCEIRSLDARAFASVPSLTNITLDNNMIDTIHAEAFEGLPNLEGLYLQDNNFKVLPPFVFSGLSLQDLYLEGNAIHILDDDTFSGLTLYHLNMKRNNISRLTANHIKPLSSSLVSFHLDNNGKALSIDTDTFYGFDSLEVLSVAYSELRDLNFLEGVSVKTLDLSGNRFPELDLLPYRSLSSIETLSIADMGLYSFRANKILYSLGSLQKLDVSNNGIFMLDGSWFQYTPKLFDLNLSRNRLYQLPENLGAFLGKLKSLDLAMNGIRSILSQSFDDMDSLTTLDLRNNKVQVFPASLKPLFDRIPILRLEGNPLHCNCEMVWYLQWLYTSPSMTAATMCFSPMNSYIYNIPLDDFVCRPPTIVAIESVVYVKPGDDVYLKCVGEGDPAPIVEWTDPFGEALTISPNVNKTRYNTYNTWKLSAVTQEFTGNYTCRARNIEGEVWRVTYLVVTDEPPPTTSTETPTTEEEGEQTTISFTTSSPTTGMVDGATTGSPVETTAETLPVNAHSRTTEMTTLRWKEMDKRKPINRTLAIIAAVVCVVIILLFAIIVCLCYRRSRHQRKYDVSDKSIIYRPENNELDISKDSKQIEV